MIGPRRGGTHRLIAALRAEARLQLRQGFYGAVAFVVVTSLAILAAVPDDWVGWLLPLMVLGNVITNTFYFIGGLVLLEKREGTIEALVVTPLRWWEYLAAKVISLTVLSLVENVTICAVAYGPGLRWAPLVGGIVAASAVLTLGGFLAVVRYDSINEYLLPSIVYATALGLPFLAYFGVWDGAAMMAHPIQAPLELMRSAFQGVERPWLLAWGLAYGAAWAGLALALCDRAFERFVVAREGAR